MLTMYARLSKYRHYKYFWNNEGLSLFGVGEWVGGVVVLVG